MTASTVIGSIRMQEGVGVVRMEDVYDTSPADLWGALTEPDRLVRWLAEVSGDLRVGGELQAKFTSSWEGTLRIDECVPGQHLLLTSGVGETDEMIIEATLTPDGSRTRLVIEERGFVREELHAHGAGWQAHVEDLRAYLAGAERRPWVDRWRELDPSYLALADEL